MNKLRRFFEQVAAADQALDLAKSQLVRQCGFTPRMLFDRIRSGPNSITPCDIYKFCARFKPSVKASKMKFKHCQRLVAEFSSNEASELSFDQFTRVILPTDSSLHRRTNYTSQVSKPAIDKACAAVLRLEAELCDQIASFKLGIQSEVPSLYSALKPKNAKRLNWKHIVKFINNERTDPVTQREMSAILRRLKISVYSEIDLYSWKQLMAPPTEDEHYNSQEELKRAQSRELPARKLFKEVVEMSDGRPLSSFVNKPQFTSPNYKFMMQDPQWRKENVDAVPPDTFINSGLLTKNIPKTNEDLEIEQAKAEMLSTPSILRKKVITPVKENDVTAQTFDDRLVRHQLQAVPIDRVPDKDLRRINES